MITEIIRKYNFFSISIRILTVGLNFVANMFINRSLGLALKGQYTTILNYANFLQLFLNLGICYAYPILLNRDGEDNSKKSIMSLIWIQTLLFGFASVVVFFISPNVRTLLIVLLSTAMICNSQMGFVALIDDIKRRNIILLVSTILFIICNVVIYIFKPGNLYIIVVLLITKYVFEIIMLVKNNHYPFLELRLLEKNKIISILRIGLPTAVLVVLISCNYNIDIFLLNWMKSGDTQVGIYGVAYSLTNMLWVIPDVFKELIYNKSAREDNYNFVIKCIIGVIGGCITICMVFFVIGKWFLRLVYGQEFIVAFDVTMILFCGVIPMVAFKLIHPIYVNKGKSAVVILLLCVSVCANILSSWYLIPQYGAFGAAIASVISYSICGVLFFVKYHHDYGVLK